MQDEVGMNTAAVKAAKTQLRSLMKQKLQQLNHDVIARQSQFSWALHERPCPNQVKLY
jgi:hypothetical protein